MRFFNNRSFFLLLTFCSLLLYFFCAYNLERAEFTTYLPTYLLLFVLYIFMVRSELDLKYGIIAGVCFRLILLMSIPNLSDDYFRFIWDGYLNGIGINPFQYTPTEFMAMQTETSPIVQELYNEMNSPDYYSIYPPISQFFFSLSGFFFLNIQKGVVLMRLVLIVAELLTLLLMIRSLQELKKPTWLSMLYFLNPLVILELTGNLHLEGLSIVALLAFLFYFFRKKTGMSSVAMGVAVSIKLNPLMFIPLLFRSVDLKRMMIYVVIPPAMLMILLIPFYQPGILSKIMSSIELYFQSFEFNASIYYIGRWIGYQLIGYNIIETLGMLLGLGTVGWIFFLSLQQNGKKETLPVIMLLAMSGYLFMSTTVHPWYLTPLIALSVFTRYRFAILWSALIFFSYGTYATAFYQENLLIVGFEYGFTWLFFGYEFIRYRKEMLRRKTRVELA